MCVSKTTSNTGATKFLHFFYCGPTYGCTAPKSCIPFQSVKPQPSVEDWVFMLWGKWKTLSALVGTYIYCMFKTLDWFQCFSCPWLLFILAHALWQTRHHHSLGEIIEERPSCCVERMRRRVNVNTAEDVSEPLRLEASGPQLVGNPWQCDFLI